MPISTLDQNSALIVIDLQTGIISTPKAHPVSEIIGNAVQIIEAFRQKGLPVVLVNVAGGAPGRTDQGPNTAVMAEGWSALIPELNQRESDHLVTKRTWGAFTNTDLNEYLHTMAVTQVVIVGISTSIGVESTARQAQELGFNVTLILDAMTDTNVESHTHSITRIFPRLGETGTTAQIISFLRDRK